MYSLYLQQQNPPRFPWNSEPGRVFCFMTTMKLYTKEALSNKISSPTKYLTIHKNRATLSIRSVALLCCFSVCGVL